MWKSVRHTGTFCAQGVLPTNGAMAYRRTHVRSATGPANTQTGSARSTATRSVQNARKMHGVLKARCISVQLGRRHEAQWAAVMQPLARATRGFFGALLLTMMTLKLQASVSSARPDSGVQGSKQSHRLVVMPMPSLIEAGHLLRTNASACSVGTTTKICPSARRVRLSRCVSSDSDSTVWTPLTCLSLFPGTLAPVHVLPATTTTAGLHASNAQPGHTAKRELPALQRAENK